MTNLSQLDLGSLILSVVLLLGFIGTFFVLVRLVIIAINVYNEKKSNKTKISTDTDNNLKKGF